MVGLVTCWLFGLSLDDTSPLTFCWRWLIVGCAVDNICVLILLCDYIKWYVVFGFWVGSFTLFCDF